MANTFLSLSDTPSSYFGHEGKTVIVNDLGTGVSFRDLKLDSLLDTELSGGYLPQPGQVLTFSAAGKSLFYRFWSCYRLRYPNNRRYPLQCIHCAGVDNAYCIDAKRRKRLFWYLFSKISWNNI